MLKSKRTRLPIIILVVVVVVGIVVVVASALLGSSPMVAAHVLSRYPLSMLASSANKIDECSACHDTTEMHTCTTCHDDHGSVELSGVPFDGLIELIGDVPDPGYIAINDILPYHEEWGTHVSLLDFLADHGVTDFQSVSMVSADGGLVTIERPNLTQEALLMPHVDGVRFAAEDLHVSTWLKGITRIIVVGTDRPLTIDGEATSIGRLLVGPTAFVTVEQTDVLLKSDEDGQVRRGKTASRVEGAPLSALLQPGFTALHVRNKAGDERTLSAEEVQGAVVALFRGEVTLILPGQASKAWVKGVVSLDLK